MWSVEIWYKTSQLYHEIFTYRSRQEARRDFDLWNRFPIKRMVHARLIRDGKVVGTCGEYTPAVNEDEEFELGLFPAVLLQKDGVTVGEYRPLCFGSINVMNHEAVKNALVYTLKTLGLENPPDALDYVNMALAQLADDDAEEKALARELAAEADSE